MDGEPRTKRPRVELADGCQSTPCHGLSTRDSSPIASNSMHTLSQDVTRDTEFWFSDGSIVLIAGNVAFKIYKELLASQSDVVADMIGVATDPQAVDLLDGSPVVCLSDSPEDLRHLLRILVPRTRRLIYTPPDGSAFSFDQLSSLVRLGHKYGIEDVEKQALSYLKLYYTTKFECWEAGHTPCDLTDARQSIGAVNLARLTGNIDMLPVALYTCATLKGEIAKGWVREDGTVEYLSPEDLGRCIEGFGRMCGAAVPLANRVFTIMSAEQKDSTHVAMCALHIRMLRTRAQAANTEALNLLHGASDIFIMGVGLCANCKAFLKTNDKAERRRVWAKLPSWFGLEAPEGWDPTIEQI
ncbi:hypothetical protein C8Q78DRAFT_27991 [Trametes maxima]|nr:hypothetical protein C8Q78DRAFT_27991 [Trametes maxima]